MADLQKMIKSFFTRGKLLPERTQQLLKPLKNSMPGTKTEAYYGKDPVKGSDGKTFTVINPYLQGQIWVLYCLSWAREMQR